MLRLCLASVILGVVALGTTATLSPPAAAGPPEKKGVALPPGPPFEAIEARFGRPDRLTGSGRSFLHYDLKDGTTLTLIVGGGSVIGAEHKSADEVGDGPVPARNEIAMPAGTTVTAETPAGKIIITAGKGLKRSYTWEGATRSVEMWPREERWYGSLGLYFPGPGEHWEVHNGITRGVVEEGQQHFKTAEEAQAWLAARKYMPFVYRNDGLVVGWQKAPARRQLNVEVWQLYINGNKPAKLEGSQDDKIKVDEPKAPEGKL